MANVALERSARRPVRFRGGGFAISPRRWASPVSVVAIIAVWQASIDLGWINPLFLPSPVSIGRALYNLTAEGVLQRHVGQSLVRIGFGWSLGTIFGLAIGFAMGLWSIPRAAGVAIISALFPIPKIALLPLFILWLGIGESSKIITIMLGVCFPTAIATFSAIDSVPRNLIRMAQSFDIPAPTVLYKIVLPGALPGILSAFRITASISLLLLVSAEMIGADYGIGAFVLHAGNLMQTDQLLAGVIVLSAMGLIIGTTLSRLERWLLRWR